jgi:hypothetical protein
MLARATAVVLLACTLLALLEVARRYLLGQSFEWQQDAVTLFILSAVFLYFGISQRRDAHLNVNLLTGVLESLGPRARRAAEAIKLLATCISFVFLLSRRQGQRDLRQPQREPGLSHVAVPGGAAGGLRLHGGVAVLPGLARRAGAARPQGARGSVAAGRAALTR